MYTYFAIVGVAVVSAVLGVLAWRKKAAPKAGPEFRMHRRWISQ